MAKAGTPFWTYVADSPFPETARLVRWSAPEFFTGAQIRRAWGISDYVSAGGDMTGKAPLDFDIQLFHVRSGTLLDDNLNLPTQGVEEGDVLLKLTNAKLLEYAVAVGHYFPSQLPLKIAMTGSWLTLAEIEVLMQSNQPSGPIFHADRDIQVSGVIASSIEHSRVLVKASPVDSEIRDLLTKLQQHVTEMVAKLPPNEAELAAADLEIIAEQATAARPERKLAALTRAADSLLSMASKVASAGSPIVGVLEQIKTLLT